MKKTTFQRKQKVIKSFLILLIIVFVSNLEAQTLLTIGPDGALTINNEGTLNVSGLELKPNTDYTINQIEVSKELTSVPLSDTESMDKVYT